MKSVPAYESQIQAHFFAARPEAAPYREGRARCHSFWLAQEEKCSFVGRDELETMVVEVVASAVGDGKPDVVHAGRQLARLEVQRDIRPDAVT